MSSLSPLDLLSISDNEQVIFRCLNKTPRLTTAEIVQTTKIPLDKLEEILNQMVQKSQLVEQLIDGKRTFSVRFSQSKRNVQNLPASVLDIFERPPDIFLAQVPLTATLTPQERDKVLTRSTIRKLVPDEVYLWQGKNPEYIGLLRNGLLKKSRLKGHQKAGLNMGYVSRGDWLGLSEALSQFPAANTYTAVTDCELLLWSISDFLNIVTQNSKMGLKLTQILSQKLHECQDHHVQGKGKIWAMDSASENAGGEIVAANLALLVAQDDLAGGKHHIVLWNLDPTESALQHHLGIGAPIQATKPPNEQLIFKHSSGVDLLFHAEYSDYPPQVQLDILLTALQAKYDYIICNIGSKLQDELALRLRGMADTFITITEDADNPATAIERWKDFQPYTRPGQKRLLALNKAQPQIKNINPNFHLVLPDDVANIQAAGDKQIPLIEYAPDGLLINALKEVYRRLTLNHTISVFVPSTIDIKETFDNSKQVQNTLSYLGNLFGGATSSQAEGVWRSEDNGLVTEQVTIVRAFVSKSLMDEYLDAVVDFATKLKDEMKQEAIALDIDNELLLV